MFGKKKRKKVKEESMEPESGTIEVSEQDMTMDSPDVGSTMEDNLQPQQFMQQIPQIQQPTTAPIPQQQVQSVPPVQQVQQVQQAKPLVSNAEARIEAGEMVNVGGQQYYRYVLLANRSIGEIGEVLPLD